MWAITLYDLRFRSRQFLIAVLGAALLFAISLLIAGLAATYDVEVNRILKATGADAWVVPAGTTGPFTSFAAMTPRDLAAIAATPGVTRADPLIIGAESEQQNGVAQNVELIGHRLGAIGDLSPSSGRRLRAPGDAVVDVRMKVGLGQSFVMAGKPFTVVGLMHGRTVSGGFPIVSVSLADAQSMLFSGNPLFTTIATRGFPTGAPQSLKVMTPKQVKSDTLRPLHNAKVSINNTKLLIWLIAAVIVASLLYVSALERTRDFAVLKSLGSSSGSLFAGVAAQAVIVTLIAAGIAAASANFLKPVYALPIYIPDSAFVTLPVIAVLIGLLSSLIALRRAIRADPSLAFG